MDKLGWKLYMQHLDGQVLSPRVVKSDASIDATRHQEVTLGRIGDLSQRLVKLSELVGDACALDVEDAHDTRLEATAEEGQGRVRCHTECLVDRGGELIDLVHG